MNFVHKFTKRDLVFTIITGLLTGTIAWQILLYLRPGLLDRGLFVVALIVGTPILWILGVLLGYFLGQWLEFFNQFGKFATIGFTNFAVSDGVLNLLLHLTKYTSGFGYSFITILAFIVGVLSSYVWNKYWTFQSQNNKGGIGEFIKFFIVNVVAFCVNVLVASFVVNFIHPIGGLNPYVWANIGLVIGSAAGLIFSFMGFKFAVFKK